jgi:hypothetical protein
MSPGLIIGLEMALVLGGVLGLAVWELVRLRRDRAARRDRQPAADEPAQR